MVKAILKLMYYEFKIQQQQTNNEIIYILTTDLKMPHCCIFIKKWLFYFQFVRFWMIEMQNKYYDESNVSILYYQKNR